MVQQITNDEVRRLQQEHISFVLVDVREIHEWEEGHITNAELYPLSTWEEIPKELLELPAKTSVVCYCARGARSQMAAELLSRARPDLEVSNMSEGYALWEFDI